MVAAEPMETPDLYTPRGIEPAVRIEPAGLQSLSVERKPGEAVGLPLRRGHAQLPAEVDGSTEVAAAEAVRGTRRDVAETPEWHCELLPDQGALRCRGSGQRKHSHDDQPRPRLPEPAIPALKGQAAGGDQR